MKINPVHILLVDDLRENLFALDALLRREGLNLLKAASGEEALELLLTTDVALALIDIQMPGMDGFELAEYMRGMERTRRVPIIFLTAGASDNRRRFRGYEAGAVDFLQKPLEPDILRSKVDVFVELYEQRQEVASQRDELETAVQENRRLLAESRSQSEALREADRHKDEFLATLAHELRNPLAPIKNALSIMRVGGANDPAIAGVCSMLERQVDHMVRLVDDLMEMSRITRGVIELRKERVDLSTIIQNSIETSRPLIDAEGHVLDVHLPERSIELNGDKVRLAQVFSNLLNNAAKYTDRGGVISLDAKVEGDEIVVSVRDNGIGISSHALSKVFDMFMQADRSSRRAQGGLGIGLTLVKTVVEMHGGTVAARSEGLARGSEFIVRIPLDQTDLKKRPTLNPGIISSSFKRQSILVVDDNADAASSLAMLLKMLGAVVFVANDGPSALAQMEEVRPDVVLLDLGLPGMDGLEVARTIRANPEYRRMVLIALTGWGLEEDRLRTKEAGFDHHLVKPVDLPILRSILADSESASKH
ncbi:response regulator [bacterium]|nr:response regulator [bacterium]